MLAPLSPSSRSYRGQRGGALVWIILFIVIAGGVYFAMKQMGGSGGGPGKSVSTAYIPDDADLIFEVDFASAFNVKGFEKFISDTSDTDLEEYKALLAKHGAKLTDLKSLSFGGQYPKDGSDLQDGLIVLNADLNDDQFKAVIAAIKEQMPEGGPEIVEARYDNTAVIGTKSAVDKAAEVQSGKRQSAVSSSEFSEIAKQIPAKSTLWAMGKIPAEAEDALSMLPVGDGASATHFAVAVKFTNKGMGFTGAALLKEDGAETLVATAKMMLGLAKSEIPKELRSIVDKLKIEGKGKLIKLSLDLTLDEIAKLEQEFN